ncbi:hypothetical protein Ddye_009717 [Dipteronia dyeriana]|uniref:Uncharacterized protein n=1 Tax=Dipteronia dyeriana TaxID=168575 RepID=A0AAE0CMH0_9ROSI|nr:hypothetical protein Ddye_009717 [Dipteronia dyeriana]
MKIDRVTDKENEHRHHNIGEATVPVINQNPPFTTVVGKFNTLDYLRFSTITGVSVHKGEVAHYHKRGFTN